MPLGTRLGQKYSDLTVRNAARCAALLTRHPSRMLAFFEESRLLDDAHGLGGPQMFDQGGRQIIPDLLGIPRRSAQQMLDPIRG